MANNHYSITKNSDTKNNIKIDFSVLSGFDITPKNSIIYDGIVVNKLVIINHGFIEKILKRKIKRKLEAYLKFIMDYLADDDSDGSSLNEVLNDLSRYREIINYRYRKHLGDGYIDLLLKKIDLLEYELKFKLYVLEEKRIALDENSIGSKSR